VLLLVIDEPHPLADELVVLGLEELEVPEAAVLADVGLVLVLGVTLLDVADLPAVEGDITCSVAADILLLRKSLDILTEIGTLLDDCTLVISLGYLVKGIRI